MKTKVILATDSRGCGLKDYIKRQTDYHNVKFKTIIKRGATLEALTSKIMQILHKSQREKNNRDVEIRIAAGICNLTQKHATGELTYNHTMALSCIQKLQHLHSAITRTGNVAAISIATIPPVHLLKATRFQMSRRSIVRQTTDDQLLEQQMTLEQDIRKINHEIFKLNKTTGHRNIFWDKAISRGSIKTFGRRKKYKKRVVNFNYEDLYDGVHPNTALKQKWFKLFCYMPRSHC